MQESACENRTGVDRLYQYQHDDQPLQVHTVQFPFGNVVNICYTNPFVNVEVLSCTELLSHSDTPASNKTTAGRIRALHKQQFSTIAILERLSLLGPSMLVPSHQSHWSVLGTALRSVSTTHSGVMWVSLQLLISV